MPLLALLLSNSCSTAIPQQTVSTEVIKPTVKQAIVSQPTTTVNEAITPEPKLNASPARLGRKAFIRLMKPVITAENKRILHNRRHIQTLQNTATLDTNQRAWLHQISTTYKLPFKSQPDTGFWQALLNRVDIVPPTMTLAQAANESAWGNSRFAREANNYFGQWCFRKGCGLVPLRRNAGAHHEVRSFDSPAESVRAYLKNMNTSRAYKQFRKLRKFMRKQGKPLDADMLAIGLRQYSERGGAYVKSIRSMIRSMRGTFND